MVYLLLTLTALFWGGTFIAGKLLAGLVPPMTCSFLRFFFAALTLIVIFSGQRYLPSLPQRRHWPRLLLLGFTGIFSYNILFFSGLEHISAGRAALIIALTPLVITAATSAIQRETLHPLQLAGILISLVGALFVISDGNMRVFTSGSFGLGEVAILGCVLSWSAYTICSRPVLAALSPLSSVFYSILAGTTLLFPLAVAEGFFSLLPAISLLSWAALIYLGVFGTAVGFTWYYWGINQIGPSRASVFINLVPVFALLLSWLILAETFKLSVISGGILVVSGISITNYAGKKFHDHTLN